METIISFFMAMPILIILLIALRITITILIIRLICQYMAKQNAKAFEYEYLAKQTADEVCKRLVLIEERKETTYKSATNDPRDQSQGDREGATEQDESQQA